MNIDVYSSSGTKKGTVELPKTIFDAPILEGLMHQLLVLQMANRRAPLAHTKKRGEIRGSTRKLFAQKGTGRARRGSIRSPLLRGGNKAFGPTKIANYQKNMPQKMRRKALLSCLTLKAKNGAIVGLEDYPKTIKTKDAVTLLSKLPVDMGRRIVMVVPDKHSELLLSVRNIPGVKTVLASYLNPEDVLSAQHLIFLVEAIGKVEEVFGGQKKKPEAPVRSGRRPGGQKPKKTTPKKKASKSESKPKP